MTPIVHVHPDARREFDEAVDYYERESPGLGTHFAKELEAGLERIRRHPEAGRAVAPDVRILVLVRFPYRIMYRTAGDTLTILAVAHQRKRPNYWRDR